MFTELSKELKNKKIVVVGAGGLGGNIINHLSRLGVGEIIIIDGDSFDESNLNRQLYANLTTIGKNKALVAAEESNKIGLSIATAIPEFLSESHIPILKGADCIFDATDNISARLYLEQLSARLQIPIIHGAVNAFSGQIAVIRPGDKTLSKLYFGKNIPNVPTLNFVPSTIANLQVCQMIKLFSDSGALKSGEVMLVDIFLCEIRIINVL